MRNSNASMVVSTIQMRIHRRQIGNALKATPNAPTLTRITSKLLILLMVLILAGCGGDDEEVAPIAKFVSVSPQVDVSPRMERLQLPSITHLVMSWPILDLSLFLVIQRQSQKSPE